MGGNGLPESFAIRVVNSNSSLFAPLYADFNSLLQTQRHNCSSKQHLRLRVQVHVGATCLNFRQLASQTEQVASLSNKWGDF